MRMNLDRFIVQWEAVAILFGYCDVCLNLFSSSNISFVLFFFKNVDLLPSGHKEGFSGGRRRPTADAYYADGVDVWQSSLACESLAVTIDENWDLCSTFLQCLTCVDRGVSPGFRRNDTILAWN